MTDHEVLVQVLSCIDPSASSLRLVRRNGRILLGLPAVKEPGARALGLYQPQRLLARGMVAAIRRLSRMGLQGFALPEEPIQARQKDLSPALSGVESGTCGVLLGSPEHRVRRAIASYRFNGQWEVAKISFGAEGRQVLEKEAKALGELQSVAKGVPDLLGLHTSPDVTVLRMPYLQGDPIPIGRFAEALGLLEGWVGDFPEKPISDFPEWQWIESALDSANGHEALQELSHKSLRPAICHGDFTRWNLRTRKDDSPVVLDWEWGHSSGMPGIDLVHYFLQDHRLVKRMSPEDAIRATISDLYRPECSEYLRKTGWGENRILPIIASLAWKQGAGHQDNQDVLEAAVELILDV
ncbi:phosphotransferase [Akkermansiaceae bacterium]|nr:phosphotransferase [Akkermansiaceae bacterium]